MHPEKGATKNTLYVIGNTLTSIRINQLFDLLKLLILRQNLVLSDVEKNI
jgi:hypothetical protein